MAQGTLRTERLRENVAMLASEIGERNLYRYENLQAAARFIEHGWQELGYGVSRQVYQAKELQFANDKQSTELGQEDSAGQSGVSQHRMGKHRDGGLSEPPVFHNQSRLAAR